jgi:MFS family permease
MELRGALGGMLALAIGMGVGRFAYTPILPLMHVQAGLGDQDAGLLASVNLAGYLIGALVVGRAPRGRSRTAIFRAALLLSLATTAGMAATHSLALWATLRGLSGIASAGIFILGSAMVLDRLAVAGRERLAGLAFAGVGLGIAGSGAFVALSGAPWDGEWLGLGVISALLAIPVWLWLTDRSAGGVGRAVPASGQLPPILAVLAIAYFLEGGGYIVTGTFLVAFLDRTPETAAYSQFAWILAGLAAMGVTPLWTVLGGKIGVAQALVAAHVVQAGAILLPVVAPGAGSALLGALGFGGTFIAIVSLSMTLGRRIAPGNSARVIGLLTIAYAVGQILAPLLAGVALQRSGRFDLPLTAAAIAVLAGGILVAASPLCRRARTQAF